MHFALISAAEHVCWVTAHLYEEQMSTGTFAVTRACCQPVSPRNFKQSGMHSALTSAAVHWCWVTAHLYEEQMSIGIFAVTRASCQPVLQYITGSEERILP